MSGAPERGAEPGRPDGLPGSANLESSAQLESSARLESSAPLAGSTAPAGSARLELAVVEARLRAPLASAHGTTHLRRLVRVKLTAPDGVAGHGEAAPLASYDGVDVEQVVAELERWRAAIEAGDGPPADGLAEARAAVDLARWDLCGRRAGQPVWRLLGGKAAPVPVNATIGAEAPEQAAAQASEARAAGYPCVKLKVGTPDDRERVRAVRAAVPEIAIRLDANGAWSVDGAVAALDALAPLGIELCEEPVHGVAALAAVAARTPVPVAADESARAVLAAGQRVCACVCLKIAASGGISGLIDDARRARAAGYDVYLASTLDGPLGIAAALHAAAAVAPDRPCGLATLGRFDAPDPLPATRGTIAVPAGPGLLSCRQFS